MSDPVGQELSVNVKEVPELDGLKAGAQCTLVVTGEKLGQHTHVAGKKETMADIRITSIKYEDRVEDIDE